MDTFNPVHYLANKLHDDAWNNSSIKPICRNYMQLHLDELRSVDPEQLLLYVLNTYDGSFNESLLLSAPELWQWMDIHAWMKLMTANTPRPPISYADTTGKYSDIVLFIAWLNLDVIEFITGRVSTMITDDRAQICNFCRANADLLVFDEEGYVDLDGNVFCKQAIINEARDRLLLSYPELKPQFASADGLREYSSDVLARIQNDRKMDLNDRRPV